MPQFTCIDTNPPPVPDLAGIQHGLQRWKEWWSAHESEYPPFLPSSPVQGTLRFLATPNFKLRDGVGRTVRLGEFLGKTVLMLFWSVDAPASLDDVPALNALQAQASERLAILGICIPPAPSCADEHEHGGGHEHAHQPEAAASLAPKSSLQFREVARETAARLKIRFPMLVDPEGNIGARFKIEDRPAYILIDAQGKLRRRFVGFRTEKALAAIIEAENGSWKGD